MSTSTTTFKTALDSFLLPHAIGLLEYAEEDRLFADSLAALINQLPEASGRSLIQSIPPTPFTTPSTQNEAVEIAAWLYHQLSDMPTRTRHTNTVMHTWASEFQSPQDLVLGIVGVAIIGPTLGLIKSKKKKKSALKVIVDRRTIAKQSPASLATLTHTLSHGVVRQEIQLAGGNVYNLHPHSAEWCLDEPYTTLYTANPSEITHIIRTANDDNLSHFTASSGANSHIALSPSVNDNLVDSFVLEEIK